MTVAVDELNPVAWMYSRPDDPFPPSVQTLRHEKDNFTAMSRNGWTETPLYAHPPTTNPVADRETPVGDHQMVTQEDRELVYALMLPAATTGLEVLALETIRSGKGDDAEAVQMVTRHRQAALTAARAQDRNEIEAWQVAAETWQQNFQDASCENQRLRETLERIEKFTAWGSPKYALAELRQFARQALAVGEHRKDVP